ncbi:Ubiquitin-like protein FUBI [Vulpes lagopus]
MQLLVRAWELHTLEVTGLEAFAHIKAKTHVASLEGHTIEDKVVLLAGSPLPDEAILGQCGVEALATLEMVGRMLGGRSGDSGPAFPHTKSPPQLSNGCSLWKVLQFAAVSTPPSSTPPNQYQLPFIIRLELLFLL